MANTELGRDAGRTDNDAPRDREHIHVLANTETRRSTKTSELWLAIATFAAIVIAGYVSDALSVDRAWLFATIVMTGYLVSRGLAKAGSRDIEERSLDLRR